MSLFVLKNKDSELIRFEMRKEAQTVSGKEYSSYDLRILSVCQNLDRILPFELQAGEITDKLLLDWIERRTSPLGRKLFARIEMLEGFDPKDPMRYARLCNLLSLNDTFWVTELTDRRAWSEVSLYRNRFDEAVGELVFGLTGSKYSSLRLSSPEFTSKGALKKAWGLDDSGIFLRKADNYTAGRDGLSQATAEWFASQVCRQFGVKHIPYELAVYGHADGSHENVCTCRLFTDEHIGLIDAKTYFLHQGVSLKKLTLDSLKNPATQYELGQIFGAEAFEDMMVFDALILNQDRHLGNFGYLFDTDSGELLRPAPLYDNGFSFGVGLGSLVDLDIEGLASRTTAAFLSFDDQARLFARPRHIPRLQKCLELDLEPHPEVCVEQSTIQAMTRLVRCRARQIIAGLGA